MADQSRGSLRDAIIGRRLKSIGYALYALTMCVGAYYGWYGPFPFGEGGFYFFVTFGALGFLSGFLVFKGQQYLARSESDLDRLVNSGPPAVVLLRPFESDATVLGTGKWFVGEGPHRRRTAEKRDELAPSHRFTSSAQQSLSYALYICGGPSTRSQVGGS